jgi:hypothetical protein
VRLDPFALWMSRIPLVLYGCVTLTAACDELADAGASSAADGSSRASNVGSEAGGSAGGQGVGNAGAAATGDGAVFAPAAAASFRDTDAAAGADAGWIPSPTEPVSGGGPSASCPGGNSPEVIVQSGVNGMHIALSATHVYWSTLSQIFRTPKSGGDSELVSGATVGGRAPFIDSNRLYWGGEAFTVYGMPLDTPNATPVLLASNIAGPDAWTVSGNALFVAVGNLGLMTTSAENPGTPTMLSEQIAPSSRMAADVTGVYWWDDQRAEAGTGFIRKYTFATEQVTNFARVGAVQFIRTGGDRVVWADVSGDTVIWSNTPDGSQPVQLGRAPSVFQLATDGTSAYYAAGGGDTMHIFAVPLAGGPTTRVACGVHNVYSLAVDDRAVYYSTWDATGSLSRVLKP